jgi:hypothetical protein
VSVTFSKNLFYFLFRDAVLFAMPNVTLGVVVEIQIIASNGIESSGLV